VPVGGSARELPCTAREEAAMNYTMQVVEAVSGRVHGLPADAVTRDSPSRSGGPLLPLAYRARRDLFFVSNDRWPELHGKALRLVGAAPPVRARAARTPVTA
jgi:hypothetical protein